MGFNDFLNKISWHVNFNFNIFKYAIRIGVEFFSDW